MLIHQVDGQLKNSKVLCTTLKEAYFKSEKLEAVSDDTNVASSDTDSLSTDEVQNVDPSMSGYTAAISKFAKLDD